MKPKSLQPKLKELIRVYHDLELTIGSLKAQLSRQRGSGCAIDLQKLLGQLDKSQRTLKRKIGNTLLIEKQHLKRRIKVVLKWNESRMR